ncbi:hypothetical protein M9Y10_032730 [Tritrichomonas musculus]|uniref:Flavin reductase like domain-containing protein n=1 Tax=Tritrichomonas musculus TaxID=1915356 RepID=A0ABR2GXT8_9EUKA
MNKIGLPEASKYASPNPVTLICSQKPDGSTNVATVSWWTYLSFTPEVVGFAMAKTSYTGEIVRNDKKVIITIPGSELAQTVLNCGSTTGRDTDKVKEFNIQLQEVGGSSIKIPVHSKLAIICNLKEFHEAGDHYFYICNVEQVFGDKNEEALFSWNGYSQIRPVK